MKKFLPTLAAVAVLAALLFYVFKYERGPKKDDKEPRGKVTVISFARDDARRVSITNGGAAFVLERKGKEWVITSPRKLRTNKQAIDSLMFILSEFQADRLIAGKASSLSKYGLEKPAVEVEILCKGDEKYTLKIGDATPVGMAYYVEGGAPGKVYEVSQENITPILAGEDSLRDKSLSGIEWGDATSIEATAGGTTVACKLGKDDKWIYSSPGKKGDCSTAAEGLLNSVIYSEVARFIEPGQQDAASAGLNPPEASIKISSKKKSETINIGTVVPGQMVFAENTSRHELYLTQDTLKTGVDDFMKSASKIE